MPASQHFVPMVALAAALSLPVIVAAQPGTNPSAPARPAPATPPAAVMAPSPSATSPIVTPSRTSSYVTADHRMRSSKIVGASVYNEQNEKVGTVDDVLISKEKEVSGVVLSVGGFLGIASKLVEVPFASIQVVNDRLVMAGTSKDQLGNMPDYKYSPT